MSPTARPFLNDVSKRINLFLFGDGTQDIADIYAMQCIADNAKISRNHPRNKCPYCGQYGEYHKVCNYCGAPID